MSMRPKLPQTLYGACYYNEYHPFDRLAEDFKDMTDADLTVLRVGESASSARLLRDLMEGESVRSLVFPPELKVRNSTKPIKSKIQ